MDADLLPACCCCSRRAWFEEQHGRAKAREEEEAARRKRAVERFGSYLRHARGLDGATTWDEFLDEHGRDKDVKEVRLGAVGGREGDGDL